jgi:hypothetical protein
MEASRAGVVRRGACRSVAVLLGAAVMLGPAAEEDASGDDV